MKTVRTKRYPRQSGNGSLLVLIVLTIVCVAILTAPEGFSLLPSAMPTPSPVPLPQSTAIASDSTLTLERQSWYAVQLGAFENRESALEAAETYRAQGAGGFVIEDGLFRLLASAYPAREDAQSVVDRLLQEQGHESATLYRLSAEEVILRVVATPIQASALAQGYALLPEMILELSRLSQALDRQTMDEAAVCAAAGTNRSRIHQLLATMDLSLAGADNAIVTGLTELLGSCESAMQQLEAGNAGKPLSISSSIKYNHMDILWRYIQYVRQMTAYRV